MQTINRTDDAMTKEKIKKIKENLHFQRSGSKVAASAVPYQVSFVTSSNTYGYSQ